MEALKKYNRSTKAALKQYCGSTYAYVMLLLHRAQKSSVNEALGQSNNLISRKHRQIWVIVHAFYYVLFQIVIVMLEIVNANIFQTVGY